MERKRMRFEILLERFFGNFLKIVLTNLLFAVPSAIVFAALYFLNTALFNGKISMPLMLTAIIFLFPFFAGVVAVCRNIARGDENVPVAKTYFGAIRANFAPFILHGVVVYIIALFSVLSISLYTSFLSNSWIFYALLFFCILIVLFLLYAVFYIPLMTITYDIPLKYIYKNSFLMSFGEIKNNFFATIALAVVFGICFTVTMFAKTTTVLMIVLAAMWALLVPAAATFMYVFFIYDGMTSMIDSKQKGVDRNAVKEQTPEPVRDEYADIDVSSLKDTDEYIFHNGRMVKQSTLLQILREREQNKEGDKDD